MRKIRLTAKFMMSQPGQQAITIHTLPNISGSKDNQKMKLGQLQSITKETTFFKSYAEDEAERLVPDLFLFF